MKRTLLIILLVLHVLGLIGYVSLLRDYIIDAYHGTAPIWFEEIIKAFYPRFFTEQHRFTEVFFVKKADQILWRYMIVLLLCTWFLKIYKKKEEYLLPSINARQGLILRSFWVALSIWIAHDWVAILQKMTYSSVFYQPIGWYRLYAYFPSIEAIYMLWGVWLLATLLTLIRSRYMVLFSSISVGLFLLMQGFLWGFHKLDHTWASFNYISLFVPWMIHELQPTAKKTTSIKSSGLFAMQFCVGWIYLQAGLEKILVGGATWFSPQTFQSYLQVGDTSLGHWLMQYEVLCTITAIVGVLFELFFIMALFKKNFLPFFLVLGIIFHISTYLLFKAGGILNTWTLVYFVFIPLLPQKYLKLGRN